mmetsp:Transcript_76443/g.211156  ORF Transcript_76443/g.211156 Transcript_76443/m.211156 type:complete len:231 (-) Transcript_76443:171-863(-)
MRVLLDVVYQLVALALGAVNFHDEVARVHAEGGLGPGVVGLYQAGLDGGDVQRGAVLAVEVDSERPLLLVVEVDAKLLHLPGAVLPRSSHLHSEEGVHGVVALLQLQLPIEPRLLELCRLEDGLAQQLGGALPVRLPHPELQGHAWSIIWDPHLLLPRGLQCLLHVLCHKEVALVAWDAHGAVEVAIAGDPREPEAVPHPAAPQNRHHQGPLLGSRKRLRLQGPGFPAGA